MNRSMNPLRSKLEQNLGWAVLLALVAGCLFVLRPFVSALLWAVVLSLRVGRSTGGCSGCSATGAPWRPS